MTSENYTEVMDLVDREVWIVTAATRKAKGGLLATWVTAASIDPRQPLMLVALAVNHFTAELVTESSSFAVHLLSANQSQLALDFALGSGRERDKFDQIHVVPGESGSPILVDCLASIDCRVIYHHDVGERRLFWGEAIDVRKRADGLPLREKQLLLNATEEQRRALTAARLSDMEVQRPLYDAWRRGLAPRS